MRFSALEQTKFDQQPRQGLQPRRLAAVTWRRAPAGNRAAAPIRLDRLAVASSTPPPRDVEKMAQAAYRLTRRRFGNAISLFAPLYVFNYCVNRCRYCGFNARAAHRRRRLSLDEAMRRPGISRPRVSTSCSFRGGRPGGERSTTWPSWPASAPPAASVSMENAHPDEDGYAACSRPAWTASPSSRLYNRDTYPDWHPSGPKSVYADRINASGRRRGRACAASASASSSASRTGAGRHGHGRARRRPGPEPLALAHLLLLPAHPARQRARLRRLPPSRHGRRPDQMILALRLCFPDSGMTLSTPGSGRSSATG